MARWYTTVCLAFIISLATSGTTLAADVDEPAPATATTTDPSSADTPADAQVDTRLLDDFTVPPPGSLEPPLDEVERDPANWVGIPPEKEWLNAIRDPLKRLNDEHGLLIAGAYTMLLQQSIGPDATTAAAGDFDLTARWTPVGRGTPDTGSLYVATEYRHDLGSIPPSALGGEIGTLLGTTNGFSDRGWAVKDLYWVQQMFEDRFRLGLGRVDSENLFGMHTLQSANTSFLNQAFSTNPTIAYSGSGMGAAASWRPTESFYLSGGATNAYGNTTSNEIDLLFDEWQLFTFAEAGYVPTIEGVGEGRYRIAFWHMDERELTDQPADWGVSLIADQDLSERITVFARYGYSEADLTGVRHSVQTGGAIEGLFGSAADLTGVAAAWSQPLADLRDEKVIEAFHRMQLTGRTQFTLGMQLIFDPSNAPDVDTLSVFSARLRLTF